jgi:DNA-binding HxlR family transcriptional regulator
MHFTELWRIIPKVAKKVVLNQLKQLENDELIINKEKLGFPLEVSYGVSEKGKALGPAFVVLETWANEYATKKGEAFEKLPGIKADDYN